MSGGNINDLFKLICASMQGQQVSFVNHEDLYNTINAIPHGGVDWESFTVKYSGPLLEDPPEWMLADYKVHFHDPCLIIKDMLSNTDFKEEFNYATYRKFDADDFQCYHHFMSGDWVWKISVIYISFNNDFC